MTAQEPTPVVVPENRRPDIGASSKPTWWQRWSSNASGFGNVAQWVSAIASLCTLAVVIIGTFRALPLLELQLAKEERAEAVLIAKAAQQEKVLAEEKRLAAEAGQKAAEAEALTLAKREKSLQLFRACALTEKAIQEERRQVSLRIFTKSAGAKGLLGPSSPEPLKPTEIPVSEYLDQLLNAATQAQSLAALGESDRKNLLDEWKVLRGRTSNTVSAPSSQPFGNMGTDGKDWQTLVVALNNERFAVDRAIDGFASQLVSTCFGLQLNN